MNLIKSTGTFSLFVILSRILGYIRDFFIAIYLGSGPIADAFFVAFRIPNTLEDYLQKVLLMQHLFHLTHQNFCLVKKKLKNLQTQYLIYWS